MKKTVKIAYTAMWPDFDPVRWLLDAFPGLADRYVFQPSPHHPDFIIYSVFGPPLPPGPYKRVFYTGENWRANFAECEYAIGFDYEESIPEAFRERYVRIPLYVFYGAGRNLIKRYQNLDRVVESKTKFCNFVYFNSVSLRNAFCRRLAEYKPVDCPGRCLNNMSGLGPRHGEDWQAAKVAFLKPYKFTIAFENSSYPGYATEKIYHPMLAKSLPIYWGNPLIHWDFNPASFINCHDYKTYDDVIDRIVRIDQDEDLYRQYLQAPWYHDNVPSRHVDRERLTDRLAAIFG